MQETCPICQEPISPGQPVCTSCGYHFATNTLSFSPVTIATDEAAGVSNAKPLSHNEHVQATDLDTPLSQPVLRMVRGNQLDTEYRLNPEQTSIGRRPECDIFLNDMTVSRSHASIAKTNDVYIISDEDSFNGVWVNNRSVSQKALETGDFIQIGKFAFVFDLGE